MSLTLAAKASSTPLLTRAAKKAAPNPVFKAEPVAEGPLAPLIEMLRYRRPAGSKSERAFITRFIDVLPGVIRDGFGNRLVRVGEGSPILWSAHTDTVHRAEGMQKLTIDQGRIQAVNSNCLGADDTVGCFLLIEMIKAGVPGLYIFHREEEIGGNGSRHIARSTPEVLDGIDFAIAFDRKGYDSVISHQFGRCCSDDFAKALAGVLGAGYRPDATGVFTDTANYTELIAECTNVSCGYFNEHTPIESVDIAFVRQLLDTLLAADFSGLVATRKPGLPPLYEPRPRTASALQDDFGFDRYTPEDYAHASGRETYRPSSSTYDLAELERFCQRHPAVVADYLHNGGHTVDDLEDWAGTGSDAAWR